MLHGYGFVDVFQGESQRGKAVTIASLPTHLSNSLSLGYVRLHVFHSPANAEAAQLYRENMKEYVRRVKATVEDSWLDPDERAEIQESGDSGQS